MKYDLSQDSRIEYGVSWYPELWPEASWEEDVAKMAEVGFTLVRLFEFAWKRFEASEGSYDFSWARKILDLLHAQGIQAMIGTPTAAPPAWLTSAYPEVLGTNRHLKQKTHGTRKHYNPHSLRYREFSVKIVSRMVEELGDHPAVHSWQIDNEMSGFDYGPETVTHFHQWLEKRYGTVEAMNETWGLNFWSQAYDRFDQVPLVTSDVGSIEQPERHHPSLIMAIATFQNEAWTRFIDEQAAVIRTACPQHPITTNMTGFLGAMDWSRHFRGLDRAGASMYADLAHYDYTFNRMDRIRAEKEAPFWMLETAPNWSGGGPIWNIHHEERGIRAFSWLTMIMGGSMLLYWQWRSHWAGQEMQHGTCVGQNGQWMPGKSTWQQLAREFKEHGEFLLQNPCAKGPIGILADSENVWLNSIDPIDPKNRYADRLRDEIQLPLLKQHYHRDILHPDADLSRYQLLIVPWMSRLPEDCKQRLEAWVKQGGRLLLGPHSGVRTEEMTLWIGSEYGGLESMIGAKQALRFTPHWVEDTQEVLFTDASRCHPRFWCEAFDPEEGTEVLAHYRGGYGEGLPAVISHAYGEGRVITVGTSLDETCYLNLVSALADECDIQPLASGGDQVLVVPRVNAEGDLTGLGIVNTRKEAQHIEIPFSGTDLLSGETCSGKVELEPLQVRLLDCR